VDYDLREAKKAVLDWCDNGADRIDVIDVFVAFEFDYTGKEAKLIVDDMIDRELLAENNGQLSPLYEIDEDDDIESETEHTNRERHIIFSTREMIDNMGQEYAEGVPYDKIIEEMERSYTGAKTCEEIEFAFDHLLRKGEVYEPKQNCFRTS
jgi:hypothetical protein